MKHGRGIDLGRLQSGGIVYMGPLMDPVHTTFDDIPEWNAIGGHCSKCERESWMDRWEVSKRWGKTTYLGSLTMRLRCRGCGNRDGNKWIVGQLPR